MAGFAVIKVTKDITVARQWATTRALLRAEQPVLLAAPRSQLQGLLQSRVARQILDKGEEVILRRDFSKVGPGIFRRLE